MTNTVLDTSPINRVSARVLLDSRAPNGRRLITFLLTCHRYILAELNTHGSLSRNSASSRAIPVAKTLARVEEFPAMPVFYGRNQSGMQAREELDDPEKDKAREIILSMRNSCVDGVKSLAGLGLHKQHANRYIEPWMWHEVVFTGTNWANFFARRLDPVMAQPEMFEVALACWDAAWASTPVEREEGEWHLPFITPQDRTDMARRLCPHMQGRELRLHTEMELRNVSVGRVARVSYLNHENKRSIDDDLGLCRRLLDAGHCSPFEHIAYALPKNSKNERHGKLVGWCPYRMTLEGESASSFTYEERTWTD